MATKYKIVTTGNIHIPIIKNSKNHSTIINKETDNEICLADFLSYKRIKFISW